MKNLSKVVQLVLLCTIVLMGQHMMALPSADKTKAAAAKDAADKAAKDPADKAAKDPADLILLSNQMKNIDEQEAKQKAETQPTSTETITPIPQRNNIDPQTTESVADNQATNTAAPVAIPTIPLIKAPESPSMLAQIEKTTYDWLGRPMVNAGSFVGTGLYNAASSVGNKLSNIGSFFSGGFSAVKEYISPSNQLMLEAAVGLPAIEQTITGLNQLINSKDQTIDKKALENILTINKDALNNKSNIDTAQNNSDKTFEQDILVNLAANNDNINDNMLNELIEKNTKFLYILKYNQEMLTNFTNSNATPSKSSLQSLLVHNELYKRTYAVRLGKKYGLIGRSLTAGAALTAAAGAWYLKNKFTGQ